MGFKKYPTVFRQNCGTENVLDTVYLFCRQVHTATLMMNWGAIRTSIGFDKPRELPRQYSLDFPKFVSWPSKELIRSVRPRQCPGV